MRVILVGPEGDRDRLRWQLEGTRVTVVGEFATVPTRDARASRLTACACRSRRAAISLRSDPLARAARSNPLTPREIEVLELLAEGLPNKAIAARLGISDQTVKFHVASITGKLGAANRTDAVRRAVRRGMLASDDCSGNPARSVRSQSFRLGTPASAAGTTVTSPARCTPRRMASGVGTPMRSSVR